MKRLLPASVCLMVLGGCTAQKPCTPTGTRRAGRAGSRAARGEEGNLSAYDHKDVDAAMRFVDSRSPDYASTKQAIEEQIKDLQVSTQLVTFDYIGHDDQCAVARAEVKSTGKPGTGFVDNTVDAIVIFHQESGAWKLWSEEILGVDIAQ